MFRLVILAAALVSDAAAAAGSPPKLRLSEVQSVTPERYRVELTLDPAKEGFAGNIRIPVKINRPLQTIWLNANKITVQTASVSAGSKTWTAAVVPGGDDFLGLQLDSPVPAGAAEISIAYTGVIRRGDTSGIFQTEDGANRYLITQFESTDARDAFPCFDEPSYKVPWQLTLHIPAQLEAVSNTPPQSDNSSGGTRTIAFRETRPLPSYLVAFGVGPFEFVDAGVAGKKRVPVRIVVPKGRSAEAKYASEITAEILSRLEDYFGIPFPYEKSDQLAVPVTLGFGAMENPGLVTYGQNILLAKPETDTIRRQREYASVAAHELSHQWFGDLVTPVWWDDIWLNEAFASWMEQKLIAEWKPEWNTRVSDVASKLGAAGEDSLITARKIRQEIVSKDDISNAFDGITYQKGAAVIGMFENWMGTETFRKGVQRFLRQYENRNATSGGFLDALSTTAKQDVTGAFSTFLNQAGVPMISVELDCRKTPVLHLEQSRSLPIGSRGDTAQVWKIPFCFRYEGSKGPSECVLMTQPKMDVNLRKTASCPAWIEADDLAKGYYRVDYRGKLLDGLAAGDVTTRLSAAERASLIGNAQAMARGGKLPMADALRLAEALRHDPSRQVVQWGLDVVRSIDRDIVPDELRANYERFIRKLYQDRARELGWISHPGESDEVRLLRSPLVSAVATVGGDRDLAGEARKLAEKWLTDPGSVEPDVVRAVLTTAAYDGEVALMKRFLDVFKKTGDRQQQQLLISAMVSFRDPASVETGMQELLNGAIKLADGFPLLAGGQDSQATRKLGFEFIKTNFDRIMQGNPSIFGFSFGAQLPYAGQGFCREDWRNELQAYFAPLVDKYEGAPRNLAQVLETVDLCIARTAAQKPGVSEFLTKY